MLKCKSATKNLTHILCSAQEKKDSEAKLAEALAEQEQLKQDMARMYDIRRYDTNFMADAVTFLKKTTGNAGGPRSSMVGAPKRT